MPDAITMIAEYLCFVPQGAIDTDNNIIMVLRQILWFRSSIIYSDACMQLIRPVIQVPSRIS